MKKIKGFLNKGKNSSSKKELEAGNSSFVLEEEQNNSKRSLIVEEQATISSKETPLAETAKRERVISTNDINNILLIGRSGNGKSTLANVITGTNEFKESKLSVSQTRNIQSKEFEVNGVKYQII